MKLTLDDLKVTLNGKDTIMLVKDDIKLQQTTTKSNVQIVVKFFTFIKPKGSSRLGRFISVLPMIWNFCKY